MIPQVTWEFRRARVCYSYSGWITFIYRKFFGKLALIAGRAQTLGRILEAFKLLYKFNRRFTFRFNLNKKL